MRLFVDGQIFQTGALERGMGTLTIELLRAAQRQDPELDVTILLNDKLPISQEHSDRLYGMLDGFTIDRVSLETPATGPEARANEQLETYIKAQTTPSEDVTYLIPALFLFDYFGLFPRNCKTVLIFHDLIPLVMWDYLKNVFPGHVYFARFSRIFEADVILANSQNTKQELVRLLGLDDQNVVVMGGAPETIRVNRSDALKRVRALGVGKPYILLPTGGGHMDHKNNMRVAEALYLLRRDTDRDFLIVATSRYEEYERQAMRHYLGDSIFFTDNISTPDMQALYRCADVVLAPALAEGLGIPLLNGVNMGIPVAASSIPVYTELSDGEDAFYEFDPYDIWEMRDAIFAALARAGFEKKQEAYERLLKRYTWDNCALHLIVALKQEVKPRISPDKRLDVLMPDPIVSGGSGYLAQSLFAVGAKHGYDIHYYIDPSINPLHYDDRGADYIRYVAPTYDITAYDPQTGKTTPKLVFLSRNADFTRLHLLSRVIADAVVYVSDNISDRLYDAMVSSGLLDPDTGSREKEAQLMLTDAALFNAPHAFLRARGILVEERSKKKVKQVLETMGVECPVHVLPDNHNKDLNDYVQQAEPVNDAILDFVAEVLND